MKSFLEIDEIYNGRAENLLDNIQPESVSLSFWSPPYFVGKNYEKNETYDSWQEMLKVIIQKHERVLKPGCFLVINIADILCFVDESIPRFQAMNISNQKCDISREMVLEAKEKHPHYNRDQLAALLGCSEQTIDRRLNGNNIRGGKYQPQTRVKLVGCNLEKYAYDAGLYLYDRKIWIKDPAWANSRWTTNTYKGVSEYEDLYIFWKPGEYSIDRSKLTNKEWRDWGSRSLWYIDSVRRNDVHEAMFPVALAERVIRLYTDKEDIVLDPFMGSGTTAIAAIKTDRHFIGFDKEEMYVELAKRQIHAEQIKTRLPLYA
jgi:DNA modification methylase